MNLFEYDSAPAQGTPTPSLFGLSNEPTQAQLNARNALQVEADLLAQQYSVIDAKAQEVALATQEKQAQLGMADMHRTSGEIIGDVATSAAGALWSTVAEGTTALAALTGNETAMDLYQGAVAIGEDIRENESDVRQAQRARYDAGKQAMHDSEEYKALSDIDRVSADAKYTAQALLENPTLIEDIGVSGIADILGAMAGGALIAKGAGKVAKGAVADEAKEAAAEKAGAYAGVAAYEATTGAGQTASQVISEVEQMSHEDLMESGEYRAIYASTQGTEEEKQEAAKRFIQTEAGKEGALSGATLALVAGRVTGADKAIADIATQGLKSTTKQAVKDTAKEGVEETLQSGAEQAAVNVALQRQDIDRDLVEGVGEAAVQGAVGGTVAAGSIQGTRVVGDVTVGTAKAAALPFTYLAKKREEKAANEQEAKSTSQSNTAAVVTAEATEVSDAIIKATTPSEPVEGEEAPVSVSPAAQQINTIAQEVQAKAASFQEQILTMDNDSPDALSDLLGAAAVVQDDVRIMYSQMDSAIKSGTLTEAESTAFKEQMQRISNTDVSTVYAQISAYANRIPPLQSALDTALDAMKRGDAALLTEVTSKVPEGFRPELQAKMKTILQGAVLYSSNFLADDSVTVDDINAMAAQVDDPELKARYEAVAKLKSMDEVANEVVDGEEDFKGVKQHLRDLSTLMGKGKDTQPVIESLTNFMVQRERKAAAIEQGIADLKAGKIKNGDYVTYGDKETDRFQIMTTKSAEAMAAQVRKEEGIVADALHSAMVMLGNANPLDTPTPVAETTVEAPTEPVQTELELVEPDVPVNEELVVEAQPATVAEAPQEVPAETPQADPIQEFEAEVTQTPELRNMVAQQFDEEARAETVSRATETIDVELDELKVSLAHREGRLETFMAQGNQPMVEATQQRVREAEEQIARLQERRDRVAAKADYQFTLENMDWGLVVNAEAMDTAAEQAQNLVEEVLETITSEPTKRILEGQYAEFGLNMGSPKAIKSFLRDRSYAFLKNMLSYIQSEVLSKSGKDKAAITKLLNSSTAIIQGSQTLKSTMASLKTNLSSMMDLNNDFENMNRFKVKAIAFKPSKLWEDTDYLTEVGNLQGAADTEIKAKLKGLGFDVSRLKPADYNAVRNLAAKRNWFNSEIGKLTDTMVNALTSGKSFSDFRRQYLRYLLDENNQIAPKFVDAAFIAYVNSTASVGNSFYNSPENIQRMLGLTDESQLEDIDGVADALTMGTIITARQLTDSFRTALGLKHSKEMPLNVSDGVYSAMGGMLSNLMTTDPEMISKEQQIGDYGTFRGFAFNSDKTAGLENAPKEETNFLANAAKGSRLLAQIADAVDPHPANYIGQKPPLTTAADTHIRSNERLTADQIEANNIYSQVEWEVDPTVGSFHRALSEEGYKQWKGYVYDDELDNYNAEHRKTIEGINQQITDSYQKAETFLDDYDDAENKTVYFAHEFSSVRRQQMRGAVNPQGNKYHRILVGHKNTSTMDIPNVAKLAGVRKPELQALVLAIGQAMGVDVDKQANSISIKETGKLIADAYAQFQKGEGVYFELASIMDSKGTFLEEISPDLVTQLSEVAGDSDHKMQGVLTLARMFKQAQNGKVKGFRHHMRIEVDGLTNGPAHSTFQNGLAGLMPDQQTEALARGGYLVGNDEGKNTHTLIGKGNITDSYKTVAAKAKEFLDSHMYLIEEALKGVDVPNMPKWKAENLKAAYDFLLSKKMVFEVKTDANGNPVIGIKRNTTKNPVTVTVYGGGASGIHQKMASELREAFAEELSSLATQVARGKDYSELVTTLQDWQLTLTGKKDGFGMVRGIKGMSAEQVTKYLREFTYSKEAKDATLRQTAELYGDFVTEAIDEVFESNKRSAALMNTSLNVITAMANQMFQDVYKALHTKRVAEGKIAEKDTLSSADVGYLQRKIQEALPFVRTAVGDSSNISTRPSQEQEQRIAGIGDQRTMYPTTNGKLSNRDIDHTNKTLGLPGVRAIPVLTISIDASSQIKNHLLQGKHGKYLNVLDAIDHVADKDVRAANEIFNVADLMALMSADTLGTVEKALHSAIQAQGRPLDIEGVEVIPNLQQVEINDSGASLTLAQETLRQALKGNTSPIAAALGIAPKDVGNMRELFRYLVGQLATENNNNRLARYNFVFGNKEVAFNQMAGIDNGHAQVVDGQVVLSEGAKEVLGTQGVAEVNRFNERMVRLKRKFDTGDMAELEDTELEKIRQEILSGDEFAREQVNEYLGTLSGIWQDLRGTADLDTGAFVYKFSNEGNRNIFRKTLSPDITYAGMKEETSGIFVQTNPAIPSVGAVINDILGTKGDRKTDYLDKMLKGVEIHVTDDLALGEDGSYHFDPTTKKRIIKIRKGMTTKQANTVLAHEIIHAITAGGIYEGLRNPKSLEGIMVRDLENQMTRAVNWVQKYQDKDSAADNMVGLVKLVKAYRKSGNLELKELALNEYIAIMGSEAQNYAGFMHSPVEGSTLSRALRNALMASWETVKGYIVKVFGVNTKTGGKALKGQPLAFVNATDARTTAQQFFEQDVLAQILKGLGTNGHTYMGDKRLSASDLAGAAETAAKDTAAFIEQIEDASDRFLKDGFNATVTAIARQLARVDAVRNADQFANMTPAARALAAKKLVESYLTQATNPDAASRPMSRIRGIMAEFVARGSKASQALDELSDKSKHAADAAREGTKQAITESLEEKLGDLNEFESDAVTNGIIRAEGLKLGMSRLQDLMNNPQNITQQITETVAKIDALKIPITHKNFIINEARSLGYRTVNGGATEGLNLPNAKAIVRMVGAEMIAIQDPDGSIEALVDELATLEGLKQMPSEQTRAMVYLLATAPEGIAEVHKTMDATRKNIVKQYGVGKALGLPKGYIHDKTNPNRAIKVVPWEDRFNYSGYEFVREFRRDGTDPSKGRHMALLVSKEGGNVPHVQGAMSTIEAAIGGFTTRYGSAADKSLPSLKGVAVKAVAARQNKVREKLTAGRYEPKAKEQGMLPNVNSMGEIIGYRYDISNAEKKTLLDTIQDVPDTVASYYARIGEQDVAEKFNRELVEHLHGHYTGKIYDPDVGVPSKADFVRISASEDDPKLAELWRIIPEGTKQVIKEKFGGNFLYVHKRDLDNALGYREWSVSQMWGAPSDSNRQLMVDVAEMIMGPQTKNMLRWAERALQEGVVAAKDFIVVKSVVVPVANILSNVNHLLMRGIDPVTIYQGAKESAKALQEYKANMKTLRHLQYQMEIGVDVDMLEVKDVQDALENSPINFMIEAGLLSTVIADVEGAERQGSIKEEIINSMFPEALFKHDNGLIDALKFITISRGSSSYEFLATALEAGDFCAKYIQIKESMREGMTQQEAIDEARVEYINYNTLTSRELDYLNKTGGTFFFKYFMRIQPIIMKTIANNPTRALTSWIGADTIGLPSIFDALWVTKDITATTGAYDLFRMAGGAHPLV